MAAASEFRTSLLASRDAETGLPVAVSALQRRMADSVSSSGEGEHLHSSEEDSRHAKDMIRSRSHHSWGEILHHLEESHRETQEKLAKMQTVIQSLAAQQQQQQRSVKKTGRLSSRDLYLMVLVLALSHIVVWLYWKK